VIAAIMTLTDHHLSNASAVAGNVWSIAAGTLLHGALRPTGAINTTEPRHARGSTVFLPLLRVPRLQPIIHLR